MDGGFRNGSGAGAGDNEGGAVNGHDTGVAPSDSASDSMPGDAQGVPPAASGTQGPVSGQGGATAGNPGTGAASPPPAAPAAYSPGADGFVDIMNWGKQFAFANRAIPRIWLDGLVAANPNSGQLQGWNNASKVFGLGVFSLFQTASKAKSAAGYYASGDAWRGSAEVSDLVNGVRIGFNGFKPLMELSSRITSSGVYQTIAKYAGGDNAALFKTGQANKILGLSYGNAFGVATNVLAGGFRGVAIYNDYTEAMEAATTQLDRDRATHDVWQGEIGNTLDIANDAAPFVIDGGVSWSTWLVGKVADHAAASMLEGSGYKPMSFGNDHARNLMGLASGIGLAPDVPWKDPALAQSADEKLVIDTSNSIHSAAGVGAGVTDIAVTATEGLAVGYLTGGSPTAIYGAWNVDHAVRQGINIWTDHYWQRPGEREAAVVAAGLDPKLDTQAVEYAQEDFLHRLWAGAAHDFTASYKEGKDIAGGASASDKRWLELDTMYSSPAISNATNGRGNPNGWFSPGMVWQAMKMSNPTLMNIDQAPQQAGIVAGWVAGGGIPKTYDKVKDAVGEGYGALTNTVSAASDSVVHHATEVGAAAENAAWQVKTTVTATLGDAWTATADAANQAWDTTASAANQAWDTTAGAANKAWDTTAGAADQAWTATTGAVSSATDTVTGWGSAAKDKADALIDSVAFWR